MLITLVNPTTVTDAAIIIGNFDPFMIRNRTRNFEIHRADYPPTSYADLSNFGKGDDNSRPSEGKWYRTHENLPWALDIPVDFNYPAEYISIVDAYPEFKGWAQSGGTANQAWYNNPNTQPGLIFSCESSGNSAPLATTVGQTGTAAVGQTMTGGYTYSDVDGDLEGNSIFKWYRSDDSNGTNEAQITGVSGKTYLLQAADANKYIRFSVTPMAQTGTTLGHEVKASGYAGPVTSASANCGSPFTDSRDGKTYNTVLIGNQCWMKENLNIGTMINGTQGQTNNGVIEKHCYNNLESNCGIYGGLYQWNEIMQYVTTEGTTGLCPAGWHIPTDSEWTTLITNLGGTAVAGGKMKETGTTHWNSPNNATNESGFTALPGGCNNGGFNYMGTFGLFWSSSEYTPDYVLRIITSNANDFVSLAADTKSSIYSGRCLKGDPIPVPTLTTENVTNINQISAGSGGNITNDGGSPVNARGVCWSNTVGVPTISDPHTIDGSGIGNFTSDITGLTAYTVYFLRAYATNGSGTAYGNVVAFRTLQGNVLPTLTTTSVTNIAQTTATSGGDVTSDGGASVTARGVCWSTSQNPTISNSHTTDGNGPGVFVSNLTGLIQNTLYYARAYATNSEGTNYGDEVSFTTTASSGGEPCPGTPTVLYEGKTYHTVQIGTQCWIKENLNIGTKIPGSQEQANNGTIEKYCYNNDEANCAIYGGLYQWDEMMQYVTTPGVKGICPTGWHIPTDGEWTTVTTILGGEGVAGGKMKSTGTIEAGTGMWYSPNTGATNESGFTAIPAGSRSGIGTFGGVGNDGDCWSSSEYYTSGAYYRYLYNDYSYVGRSSDYKNFGFSVRCLLD